MRPRIVGPVFAGVMAAACSGATESGGTGPPGPPPPPVSTNAVDVIDNRFNPADASAAQGSTVTWTWRGTDEHNVTFEGGQGSSATKTTGTHQRSFSAGGTFRYRCTIHSSSFDAGMVGSVIVN
jgi:plastocyanin